MASDPETANIKLASVASDAFGVSGRAMLKTLSEGNATAEEIAGLIGGGCRTAPDDQLQQTSEPLARRVVPSVRCGHVQIDGRHDLLGRHVTHGAGHWATGPVIDADDEPFVSLTGHIGRSARSYW